MSGLANQLSNWMLLLFIVGIPLYAATVKKINVFDAFIVGAKQGFDTILSIIPYLIAMMVAIGMLRASGFFTLLGQLLAPLMVMIGMPQEVLPLALIRPFSGSASIGIMAELIHQYGNHLLRGCGVFWFYWHSPYSSRNSSRFIS